MLKPVLYILLLLTTSVRFFDIVYLLAKENTNLPIPVILVTTAIILYGMVLAVRKFTSTIRLKQLMYFFIAQTGVIAFNLLYVSVATPLKMSVAEMLAAGTFLDLLVNGVLIYLCLRQIRSFHFPTVQEAVSGGRRMNV